MPNVGAAVRFGFMPAREHNKHYRSHSVKIAAANGHSRLLPFGECGSQALLSMPAEATLPERVMKKSWGLEHSITLTL